MGDYAGEPGVITTGLFSFLLAYNDFLVTSLLLDAQDQTMVPAITGYFNQTTTTDQVEAVRRVDYSAPLLAGYDFSTPDRLWSDSRCRERIDDGQGKPA